MMLRPTACAPRTSSPSSRSKRAARTNTSWTRRRVALILDRILYTSTHYPANYGFIPRTYGGRRRPAGRAGALQRGASSPLSLVRCYPIGVITMLDQGKLDEKIIAIPFKDPTYNSYQDDVSELPSHIFSGNVQHFFTRLQKS